MKIAIVLQRRFAFIGHHLAAILKEKYNVADFCGYVFLRSSFDWLKKQSDVNYTSLILDEDIHEEYKKEKLDWEYLRKLEKEYGLPNLWAYIALDRVIMFNQLVREYPYNTPRYTYEEMLRVLQVKARAVINFLEKEKPDAIIFPNNGNIASLFLYHAALKKGIKVLNILATCLKDRYLLSDTYDTFTGVEKIFQEYRQGAPKKEARAEAEKILGEFRAAPTPYTADLTPAKQPVDRQRQFDFLKPSNLIHSLRWFGHTLLEHATSPGKHDYSYIHPWGYFKDHVKRKIRNLIGASDLYDEFRPREKYAFYALHYEPEVSLLLLAPFATDQLNVIRQLARSLPVDYFLYVKEHPLMAPYRPRAYYKELKKIPNVRLLNPAIQGFDLIQNAQLVATVTGTVGWEALMLKKPVIVFGHQFYNLLSMVKYCGEMEKLPYLVKEQLENFQYNEEEILNFVAAIFEDSASLPFFWLWAQETDEAKKKAGLEPLADLIAKKLNLNKP